MRRIAERSGCPRAGSHNSALFRLARDIAPQGMAIGSLRLSDAYARALPGKLLTAFDRRVVRHVPAAQDQQEGKTP